MLITEIQDITSKVELNGIRAIIFHFTFGDDSKGRVTIQGQWGTSYAQYESNALAGAVKHAADKGTEVKAWTWVASR